MRSMIVLPGLLLTLLARAATAISFEESDSDVHRHPLYEKRANTTCFTGVRIFIARGTGEPQNHSLQEAVAPRIVAAIPDSNSSEVEYPANTDFANSAEAGIAAAQQEIYDYYNQCPQSKIVLMGYSQGAEVIGDAITGGAGTTLRGIPELEAPPLCGGAGQNVIAVILFGDPGRNIGVGVAGLTSNSCNVSAAIPRNGTQYAHILPYADRIQEWCASGDPVCCATGTNYNDHLSYFTDDNEVTIVNYVQGRYQNTTFPDPGNYNATACTPFNFTYPANATSSLPASQSSIGASSTGSVVSASTTSTTGTGSSSATAPISSATSTSGASSLLRGGIWSRWGSMSLDQLFLR